MIRGLHMTRIIALAILFLASALAVPNLSNAGGLFLTDFGTEMAA
jgi:hypothetical protein